MSPLPKFATNIVSSQTCINSRNWIFQVLITSSIHAFGHYSIAITSASCSTRSSIELPMRLQPLNAQDIHGPEKDVDDTSHGQFEPLWIWLVPHVHSAPDMGDSEKQVNNSMQVKWTKTISQCLWWEEEVELLQEEMHWVITFFKWKAQWWQCQACRHCHCHGICGKILHGVAAYAEKQAFFMDHLAQSSAECWLPALKAEGIAPLWEADFIVICSESHAQVSVLSTANDDNCDHCH